MASTFASVGADNTLHVADGCSFCLKHAGEMVNPKKLPCDHVFCLECLKDDKVQSIDDDTLICSVCRVEHNICLQSLSDLPASVQVAGEDNSNTDLLDDSLFKCTVCEEQGEKTLAFAFCPECQIRLCRKDLEIHNRLHKTHSSSVISITKYSQSRSKYDLHMCEKHSLVIEGFCQLCRQWGCKQCIMFNKELCNGTGVQHEFQSLLSLENDIGSTFRKSIKIVSEKQEDLRTAQKRIAQMMENLQVEFNEKRQKLDGIISRLRTPRPYLTDLRALLCERYEDLTLQLSNYDGNILEAAVENIRQLIARVGTTLREKNIREIVESEERLTSELAQASQFELDIPLGDLPEVNPVQNKLSLLKTLLDDVNSFCVTRNSEGVIVTGHFKEIVVHLEHGLSRSIHTGDTVNSVVCSLDRIHALCYVYNAPWQVVTYDMNCVERSRFNVAISDVGFKTFALLENELFIPDKKEHRILKYGLNGTYHGDVRHHSMQQPTHVAASSQSLSVLLASSVILTMNAQTSKVLWEYQLDFKSYGVTVDGIGRVWMGGHCQKVTVLSPQGSHIASLRLPDSYLVRDIDVHEEQLLIAHPEGVHMYSVEY